VTDLRFGVFNHLLLCVNNLSDPFCVDYNKKLIIRWDSERELSLRWHRTRTTKYNRLVHKFRHRSTRSCLVRYLICWWVCYTSRQTS